MPCHEALSHFSLELLWKLHILRSRLKVPKVEHPFAGNPWQQSIFPVLKQCKRIWLEHTGFPIHCALDGSVLS